MLLERRNRYLGPAIPAHRVTTADFNSKRIERRGSNNGGIMKEKDTLVTARSSFATLTVLLAKIE
jgi:hypothetical protein